jgi:hypothetical protein
MSAGGIRLLKEHPDSQADMIITRRNTFNAKRKDRRFHIPGE